MARLPIPGSDDGQWGTILNDFLATEHQSDGSLKLRSDGTLNSYYQKPSGGIPKADLDSSVQASLTTADARNAVSLQGTSVNNGAPADGQALVYSQTAGAWTPATVSSTSVSDATSGSKGIVQLAGDLGGTAAAPTVPGLAQKAADNSVVHKTGDETVAGVKTFSASPTVPQPSQGGEATNKTYVDSLYSGRTLAGDSDVTIASPAGGQVLTYDGTSSKWKNQALSSTDTNAVHKGDMFYNIVDYGATTGSTDNKSAIDAAITAAASAGGVVYIPAGTWKTTGQHTVPLNVSIKGAGKGVTTINHRGVGTHCFFIGSTTAGASPPNYMGKVGSFNIQGQSSGDGTGQWGQQVGIYVLNCLFFNLQDIHMTSIYKAFFLDGGDEGALGAGTFAGNGYVKNCSTANVYIGFHIYRWVTDTLYDFIYCYGSSPIKTGSTGIWIDTKPSTSTLVNPSIEGLDMGIRISTSRQGICFVNPRLENCTTFVSWENNTWGHVIIGGSQPPNGPWASGNKAGSVTHIARDGWFPTVTSLPTASSSYRGAIYKITGANGSTDGVYMCIKDDTDAYVWRELTAAASSGASTITSLVTTKGDMLAATGSATLARLPAGSNGQVLIADSTQTAGLKWGLATIGGGNFIANPSFDDGTTGYTAASGGTLSANSLLGIFGTNCAQVTRATGTGTGNLTLTSAKAKVAASLVYTASAWVRLGSLGASSARTANVTINWYTAAQALISSDSGASASVSIQGTWTLLSAPGITAPDTAAYAELAVTVNGVPEAEYHVFDGFQLEPGALPTSFNSNFPQSSLAGTMLVPATITSRETAAGSAKPFYGAAASIPAAGSAGRLYWATDSNALYFDNGTSWAVINASGSSQLDGMFDVPFTVDPRLGSGFSTVTANNVYYFRVQGSATISGLGIHIGTADAANGVNFGVYNNTGVGRNAKPSTLVSSCTLASATAGFQTATFASSVTVQHGQWFAISTASATVTFLRNAANTGTALSAGLAWFQTGGPTMPSTAGTLSNYLMTPIIVGV